MIDQEEGWNGIAFSGDSAVAGAGAGGYRASERRQKSQRVEVRKAAELEFDSPAVRKSREESRLSRLTACATTVNRPLWRRFATGAQDKAPQVLGLRQTIAIGVLLAATTLAAASDMESARDRQDRAALQKIVSDLSTAAAAAPNDAQAHYRVALASSYLAEVSQELRDKNAARAAAETGIKAAEKAIALKPNVAEYHRVIGTLCGQVIPANVLAGLSYGKRAQDAIRKALELDPKSSPAYVARGVGNYYLPSAMGGGVDLAIADFRKAIELDAKSSDAQLWLGLALRKAGQNAEARKAFTRALAIDPDRVWTRQQLEKTPEK